MTTTTTRRTILAASAAVPLAGITAALPIAWVAGSEEDGGFQELLDILETLPPHEREYIFGYARFLAERRRKDGAGGMS